MLQKSASVAGESPLSATAARLARVRADSGLNQRQFAERLGTPKRTYLAWERAEAEPSLALFRAVRREFGIDPGWLMDGPGDEPIRYASVVDEDRMLRLAAKLRVELDALGLEPHFEQTLHLVLALLRSPPEAEETALSQMRSTLRAFADGKL